MKLKTLLPIAAALWVSAAFGVSRVGTGKLFNDEIGFSAPVPGIFNRSFVTTEGDVRFDGPTMLVPGRNMTPKAAYALVFLLSNRIPEWTGDHDRAKFRAHYLAEGWERVPHADPCVEEFRLETETNDNWILSWGGGRGLVMTGPKLPVVNEGLNRMAEALTLEPGACDWN
jgi:hypothetical protein